MLPSKYAPPDHWTAAGGGATAAADTGMPEELAAPPLLPKAPRAPLNPGGGSAAATGAAL